MLERKALLRILQFLLIDFAKILNLLNNPYLYLYLKHKSKNKKLNL